MAPWLPSVDPLLNVYVYYPVIFKRRTHCYLTWVCNAFQLTRALEGDGALEAPHLFFRVGRRTVHCRETKLGHI